MVCSAERSALVGGVSFIMNLNVICRKGSSTEGNIAMLIKSAWEG